MILVGWKQIAEAYGGQSVVTTRKKAKKYHMPVVYRDGKPEISRAALNDWAAKGASDHEGEDEGEGCAA